MYFTLYNLMDFMAMYFLCF